MPKNSARCVGLRSICAMVASCKQSERRDRERASTTRTRAKSASPIARQEPLRVHHRGRHASDNSLVSADGSTNRGSRQASFPCSPTHVASFDGVQARQRWPRHAFARALSRASQLAEHSQVYRVSTGSVCEVLERLGAEIGYVTTIACNSARHPLPLSSCDNL
jgi:hypothetical protein